MLKDRVALRLEALGKNQFNALDYSSLGRHFIYDILAGKKQAVRGKNLVELARVLECSAEYLTEQSDEVGEPPKVPSHTSSVPGVPVVGVIEEGAWKTPTAASAEYPELPSLPQFAGLRQVAYLVRGKTVPGVDDGMFVIGVDADDYVRNQGRIGPGSTAIIEVRSSIGGAPVVQTTLRQLSNDAQDRWLVANVGKVMKDSGTDTRLVAIPVLATRVL